MRYLFQRVVHNENGWEAPSPGRLRFTGDGDYLEKLGFGHEDWNLSRDVSTDGDSHGYLYFRPKDTDGRFNILFATYDKDDGWAICGYFVGATFNENGAVFSPEVIQRRASELKTLDGARSLGGEYRGKSISRISELLKKEFSNYRWRVRPADIHRLPQPIRVPKLFTSRFGKYFARPTDLEEREWDRLIALAVEFADQKRQDDYNDGGDIEFPEGKEQEVRHKKRERNPTLVAKAKAHFKAKSGRLSCMACEFDFAIKYGKAGDGFIEVRHTIPLSELEPGAKTKLSDLVLVCSNCHRMLHRRRPWLTIKSLRRLIKQNENLKKSGNNISSYFSYLRRYENFFGKMEGTNRFCLPT